MLSMSKIATYAAWVGIAVVAAAARPAGAQGYNLSPDGGECAYPGDGSSFNLNEPTDDRYAFDEPGFGPFALDEPGADWDRNAAANPFNEAYSFADDPDTLTETPIAPGNQGADPRFGPPAGVDEATLLVGTWGWQGQVEGMQARIQTAFYGDGTYESYAQTPTFDLYEAGYWAVVDSVLTAQVVDYAPRFIDTPYGREPVPIETFYETALSFIDEDTVETDIGISYRID